MEGAWFGKPLLCRQMQKPNQKEKQAWMGTPPYAHATEAACCLLGAVLAGFGQAELQQVNQLLRKGREVDQ